MAFSAQVVNSNPARMSQRLHMQVFTAPALCRLDMSGAGAVARLASDSKELRLRNKPSLRQSGSVAQQTIARVLILIAFSQRCGGHGFLSRGEVPFVKTGEIAHP